MKSLLMRVKDLMRPKANLEEYAREKNELTTDVWKLESVTELGSNWRELAAYGKLRKENKHGWE